MFGDDLARVYDLVYRARGQDFDREAELVTEIVRARRPDATSLLDVGCGTGEHLLTLSGAFDHVEGLDLSGPMVSVARTKLPGVEIHLRDMRDFDLGRRFDAVISLSTAVAYLPSVAALRVTLTRMVAHLAPGGVLVVEPWYFPENYLDGYIAGDIIRRPEMTVARVSHSRERDGATHIESHWTVADRHGIRHFTENHVFGLWTREQYEAAFENAGCKTEYIGDVQAGRGLFVGWRGGDVR
ncbi:class I SAM-dependent methyltransferase [Micromonospora sp. NBC_01699]|uniref:class I SAM-dependent methyltransferase n=1 Tax=Micromonospora sp. NBC_01699 TaxID=2975984 RepID=UPI002E29D9E1|nr:class I SAM-dependent methyltransferase [Micromonospora sp. NBC_01699]